MSFFTISTPRGCGKLKKVTMSYRKNPLVTGEIYHIFTKSIAGFKIFNNHGEFLRMKELLIYYQYNNPGIRFSWLTGEVKGKECNEGENKFLKNDERIVQIIAYCIMPTHLHIILKQLKALGISSFMNKVLNSYSRYFNTKHKRRGPLWESRFKNVLVENDEQLLHLTRYIHLNPSTSFLVTEPEDWLFSSYGEYIGKTKESENICLHRNFITIDPFSYKKFVNTRIDYQRDLAILKNLLFEGVTNHTPAV